MWHLKAIKLKPILALFVRSTFLAIFVNDRNLYKLLNNNNNNLQ